MYLVIESKITFLHCNLQYFVLVIYDVLTFAARCQNAKKKLLQFRNICLRFNAFFFSSVLFQSKGTLSSPPHPPTPPSKTSATKLGNVSSVASSYSRKDRYHPPPPPTPPPGQGSKTSATKLGNVSSVASSFSRKERYHPPPTPPPPLPVKVARCQQQSWATCLP